LEGATSTLAGVISHVLGVGGRAMLEAMVEGETDPQRIADHAQPPLRATAAQLHEALAGLVGPHQRFLVATQLRHVDYLTDAIARLDQESEARMHPVADAIARLDTIPGGGVQRAQEILAAIGTERSRFPRARHPAS
jgi:transposase